MICASFGDEVRYNTSNTAHVEVRWILFPLPSLSFVIPRLCDQSRVLGFYPPLTSYHDLPNFQSTSISSETLDKVICSANPRVDSSEITARMQGHNDQRPVVHPINTAVHPLASTAYGHAIPYGHQIQYNAHGQLYSQAPANVYPEAVGESMDSLSNAFGSVNVQGMSSTGSGTNTTTTMPVSHASSQLYYLADGRVIVSNIQPQQGMYQQSSAGYKLAPSQTQFLQQAQYSGFQPGMQIVPNTSQTPTWHSSRPKPEEVPDLAVGRRNSWSSNEENGPATPFFGAQRSRDFLGGVAVADHSPNAWSTPSPQQLTKAYVPSQILVAPNGQHVYADLDVLTLKDPAIPVAIPAPFSPGGGRGTLEKSLRNDLATTNVYVRGLHPNTTDEMLHAYGARFGEIECCKAILDLPAGGMCKG